MKLKLLLTIIYVSFLMACGGTTVSNNSANSNVAKANSTIPENKNTGAENKNAENKSSLDGVNESDKIKPDSNAKLEKNKVFSTVFYNINLPSDWRALKTKDYGPWTYVPTKANGDGIVQVFLSYTIFDEEKNSDVLSNPRKWLDGKLEYNKGAKEKGEIAEFGTFGVGANSESAIPPVLGVMDMRDTNLGTYLKDENKNDKCSAAIAPTCGQFSWTGFNVKEKREWYFSVLYPPGTYEKNKPTIDAILNSIKFK